MIELIVYMTMMSITPGANTIASMANASEKGFRKGLRLNFGMTTGIVIVAVISYILLWALGSSIPSSGLAFQILGSLYLLFLSYRLFKSGSILIEGGLSGDFMAGLIMQFANVKVFLLCVTAISTFIIPKGLSFLSVLLIPFFCLISQIIWALFGHAISKIYAKHTKALNAIFALALLCLALKNIISLF